MQFSLQGNFDDVQRQAELPSKAPKESKQLVFFCSIKLKLYFLFFEILFSKILISLPQIKIL